MHKECGNHQDADKTIKLLVQVQHKQSTDYNMKLNLHEHFQYTSNSLRNPLFAAAIFVGKRSHNLHQWQFTNVYIQEKDLMHVRPVGKHLYQDQLCSHMLRNMCGEKPSPTNYEDCVLFIL